MLSSNCGQRISVIGTSGSGKTVLARQIAQYLAIPHVELDALHWEPNWTEVPIHIERKRIVQALSGNRWVIDGNCSRRHDIIWSRSDTVVWLDYPLSVVLGRLLWRTVRRVVTQEELWSGNRETLRQVFSRDSILLWALQTYSERRREYPILLNLPEYAHLKVVHLRSPQATHNWLSGIVSHAKETS